MSKISRDQIRANQDYLAEWDEYQWTHLESKNFSLEAPLLLPISIDINEGIVDRNRIKLNLLDPLWEKVANKAGSAGKNAFISYEKFFEKERKQSATPSTPIDFFISCPVLFLFHLPRENWRFNTKPGKVPFTVDGMSPGKMKHAFDILGTFDNDRGLLVLNKNWTKDNGPQTHKYNLHVCVSQDVNVPTNPFGKPSGYKKKIAETDIIIDPGMGSDDSTGGGGGGPDNN